MELPIVRLPWRRKAGCGFDSTKQMILGDLLGVAGYEIPKTVKVENWKLGALKLALISLVFVVYVYQGIYVNKDYLDYYSVESTSRMQLQHPVKNHCNPLHVDCEPNFREFEELPYCQQSGRKSNTSDGSEIVQELCIYLDEFDIREGDFETTESLIPTRQRVITEKKTCDGTKQRCKQMYTIETSDSAYVADIENFTILIDHSFVCEELATQKPAWEMVGFVRACPAPHYCPLKQLPVLPHFASQFSIQNGTVQQLNALWGADEPLSLSDAYKLPNGDVFRVGFVLEMIGVDLDSRRGKSSIRSEGISVMVEAIYKNVAPRSFPNSLPIVYEYRFSVAPLSTYKSTTSVKFPGSSTRVVNDVHGVYLRGRYRGKLGKFSFKTLLLMLLEFTLLVNIVRWFIIFLSVNWWPNQKGDRLEKELCSVVQLSDDEGDVDRQGEQLLVPSSRLDSGSSRRPTVQ